MTDAAASACFHCADPVGGAVVRAAVDSVERQFCCAGCAAAAQWIADAGLSDYYRFRERAPRGVETPRDGVPWDDAALLARHAVAVGPLREIVLLVEGMHCAACAWLIERALSRVPGVVEAEAGFARTRVRIVWDPQRVPLSALAATLERLGYRALLPASREADAARTTASRRELMRVGIAGLAAMQAMMFSEALTLGWALDIGTRDAFRWLAMLAAAPAVLWCAWPIHRGAWRELALGRLGMDTPVAASIAIAFLASVFATVTGGADVWYDAAAMFVFLVLGARGMESRLRRRAHDAVELAARARPEYCARADADGRFVAVPIDSLAADDVVRVAPGGVLPADGILLDAPASVGEAWLSGEPRPLHKEVGAAVRAGSVCHAAPLTFRVVAAGAATELSQLERLVERAAARRPAVRGRAERAAGVFVGVVLVAALATFAFWLATDAARALPAALAVLVVSCPCALALAVPGAIAAAQSRLARAGVLVVSPDALEALARVDRVVLDKTGTLSAGAPALAGTRVDAGTAQEARAIAAALERASLHPIARAFAAFDDRRRVEGSEELAGEGVAGTISGVRYRLGSAAFCGMADTDAPDGAIHLAGPGGAVAHFTIDDPPRPRAREAVADLRALGLSPTLLSGDAPSRVAAIAVTLGIRDHESGCSPADKLARVRAMQAAGAHVAMVGDGINDAPVLAGADVAIALGDGAPMAQQAADVIVLGGRIERVADAIAIARATAAVMRANVAWALAYNFIAIPFAASGVVTPWVAALGMTLSSLVVTLNSARLARWSLPSEARAAVTRYDAPVGARAEVAA